MTISSGDLKAVTLYTDGACIGNPGPGGYGVVILAEGQPRQERSGGFAPTTNNRMEIMAAIVGLETLPGSFAVTLYTDSMYLCFCIKNGLVWQAEGRKNIKNPDLVDRLLGLCARHQVRLEWVKGHAGNKENERCDFLSTQAAATPDLPRDPGYGITEPHPNLFSYSQRGRWTPDPAVIPPKPLPIPVKALQEQSANTPASNGKITTEGQSCRACGTAVVKKVPRAKHKVGQEYYFEWYLYCPSCKRLYMVESAKRLIY